MTRTFDYTHVRASREGENPRCLDYPHNYALRIMHYELPNYWGFSVLYQIFVSFAEMVTAEKATVGR